MKRSENGNEVFVQSLQLLLPLVLIVTKFTFIPLHLEIRSFVRYFACFFRRIH